MFLQLRRVASIQLYEHLHPQKTESQQSTARCALRPSQETLRCEWCTSTSSWWRLSSPATDFQATGNVAPMQLRFLSSAHRRSCANPPCHPFASPTRCLASAAMWRCANRPRVRRFASHSVHRRHLLDATWLHRLYSPRTTNTRAPNVEPSGPSSTFTDVRGTKIGGATFPQGIIFT